MKPFALMCLLVAANASATVEVVLSGDRLPGMVQITPGGGIWHGEEA
jgi:hypothetical protein